MGEAIEEQLRDQAAQIIRLRAELAAKDARIAHERVEGDKILAALEMANARIAELEAWKATCQEVDCYRVSDARAERAEAEAKDLKLRIDALESAQIDYEAQCAAKDGIIANLNERSAQYERDATAQAARISELDSLRSSVAEIERDEAIDRAERAEAERDALRKLVKEAAAFVWSSGESPEDQDLLNRLEAAKFAALAPPPAGPDGKSLAVLYCIERAEEDVKLLREALEGMIAVAEGRFDGNPHADIDALAKARAVALHLDRRPRQ